MERIVIGDGEYYANYKEPFQQLEGAMPGYPLGELPYDVDGRLLCPYVDRHDQRYRSDNGKPKTQRMTYHNLGAHLAKIHNVTADEFKDEAGLNQGAALVSERTRLLNSAAAVRRHFGDNARWTPEAAAKFAANRKGQGGTRTPQGLNKKGWCYLQVLSTARKVVREHGRITETLMRKAGVSERIITFHFGSWQAFMRRHDQTINGSGYPRRDADLIHDLRSVAAALGHTPTVSDMRRYQMAARRTYEKHFGSWVAACRRADVEPNVPAMWLTRPFTAEEDAAILGAYAMTGSYTKAAERHAIAPPRAREILGRYGLTPLNGNVASHLQRQEQMAKAAELSRRLANPSAAA